MTKPVEPLWRTTFQPDSSSEDLNALRETFLAQRAEIAIETLKECDVVLKAVSLESLPPHRAEAGVHGSAVDVLVFDDPVFAIWLRFFLRAKANGRAKETIVHLLMLKSVLQDVERRLAGRAQAYVAGSLIAVEQGHLHEYLRAAAPPSYDFTHFVDPDEEGLLVGHPLRMQADILGHAMKGINAAWPELADQIHELVRIIGYLPDATFRSCSAARYSGVVFLGNMDESVLDLEESLVHEVGHQILYRLGEVVRLTQPGTPIKANYVLPWSGSRRDLFGYFHAYYIYVLLTKYYWRRAKLGDQYALDCKQRAILIMAGIILATPVLKADPDLSNQSRVIIDLLAGEIKALHAEIRNDMKPETEKTEAKKSETEVENDR